MISVALAKKFRAFIKTKEISFLSTVNEYGVPETRAMLNLCNDKVFPGLKKCFGDEFVIYFTSNTGSRKVKQISEGKPASVYFVENETYEGLLLTGKIEPVKDEKTKKLFWHDNWVMYYRGGVNDPGYTLLKFTPSEYKFYNGSFEVVPGTFK